MAAAGVVRPDGHPSLSRVYVLVPTTKDPEAGTFETDIFGPALVLCTDRTARKLSGLGERRVNEREVARVEWTMLANMLEGICGVCEAPGTAFHSVEAMQPFRGPGDHQSLIHKFRTVNVSYGCKFIIRVSRDRIAGCT